MKSTLQNTSNTAKLSFDLPISTSNRKMRNLAIKNQFERSWRPKLLISTYERVSMGEKHWKKLQIKWLTVNVSWSTLKHTASAYREKWTEEREIKWENLK